MTPHRTPLARLKAHFDVTVAAPAAYARGYLQTRLSGGKFGPLPSITGRHVHLRIRGAVLVGKYFKALGESWASRIYVDSDAILQIGNDFRMSSGASIDVFHKVVIGNNVMMAPFSSIIDDNCHLVEQGSVSYERPVVLGDNVWLARNVAVLPGVTIGSGSVITANSVVVRDIPPNSLAGGNPAKVIRTLDIPADWTHANGYERYSLVGSLPSPLRRVISAQRARRLRSGGSADIAEPSPSTAGARRTDDLSELQR